MKHSITLCIDKHNANKRMVAALRGIEMLAGYAARDMEDSVCPTYSAHEALGALRGLHENALWLAGELDAVRAMQCAELDAAAVRQCREGVNTKRDAEAQEGGAK